MSRAIIVREKVTKLVKLLVDKKISVTQRGATAYVNYGKSGRPETVNIPYIPDDASDEFLAAIEGFLDHEVGHVLFTDYKALAKAKRAGVAEMHNVIEDAFIERKMAETFQGSALNISNVSEFFLKHRTDKKLKEEPENAVGYLMVPAIRAMSGQKIFEEYMRGKWHHLEPIMKKIEKVGREILPKIQSSEEAVDAALTFKKLLNEDVPETPEGESGEKEKPSDGKGKPGKKKAGKGEDGGTPSGDSVSEAPDPSEGEESEAGEPASEPDSESEAGGPGEDGEGEGEGPHLSEEGEGEGDGGATPDLEVPDDIEEEDHHAHAEVDDDEEEGAAPSFESLSESMDDDYDSVLAAILTERSAKESKEAEYLIYTKELDVIETFDPSGVPHIDAYVKEMQDAVDHMVGPLQKDLERAIAARSASTFTSGHRSGRINPGALARLTTFGDDRAFRRKHVNETKDVAVELLVDFSGSMNLGSKIEVAIKTAYGLSSVLERMGISHEVIGFTTKGTFPAGMGEEERRLGIKYSRYQPIYMPILKGFGERLTYEVKKRFAAVPYGMRLRENVDGECVQVAASRVASRREKRKILMVLSDGQPACPSGNYESLPIHLKKAVKEAEHQGIDVLGIGILSEAPRHFYSKYVLLNDLSELPTTVIAQVKRLLMQG